MKKILVIIIAAFLLHGCNEKNDIPGNYKYSTRYIDSNISLYPNGTFHQKVVYSGKKLELDGQWTQTNGSVQFNKLYYLVNITSLEGDVYLREPKLYYMANFKAANNMLYVEDQKQIYQK